MLYNIILSAIPMEEVDIILGALGDAYASRATVKLATLKKNEPARQMRSVKSKQPSFPDRSVDIVFRMMKEAGGPVAHAKLIAKFKVFTSYGNSAFYSAIALLEKYELVNRPSDGVYSLTTKGSSTEDTKNVMYKGSQDAH